MMSKDNEKKSSSETPLKSLYENLLLLMVIFVGTFSLIGWIFSLSVLNNIANEIQFLAFALGSGYAYLEASHKLSRSNLLLFISANLTFYSVLPVFFDKSSPFDSLYYRGILRLCRNP
jgi:ABC-type multidrug transport system fused ATPase/permease subunit